MKKRIISIFSLILCICIAFSGCSSVSTLLRLSQPLNASVPILITPAENLILLKDLQLYNA